VAGVTRKRQVATDEERVASMARRKVTANYAWTATDEQAFRRLAKRAGVDRRAAELKALYRKCDAEMLMLGVEDEDPFPPG
jgi:hypothetical protein